MPALKGRRSELEITPGVRLQRIRDWRNIFGDQRVGDLRKSPRQIDGEDHGDQELFHTRVDLIKDSAKDLLQPARLGNALTRVEKSLTRAPQVKLHEDA